MQTAIQKITYHKAKVDSSANIINFLAFKFPYLSHKKWCEAVKAGKIKVNQQKISTAYELKNLDLITYERDKSEEPKVTKDFSIIYEDDHLLAVQKGGRLPVSISGRYYQNTLIQILKNEHSHPQLYPVHRIDKETSGVVVFAKTQIAAKKMGKIFESGKHHKIYHALLDGKMPKASILVDKPLAKNKGTSLIHIRQICTKDGKAAKTLFNKIISTSNLTFAQIIPQSGRTHQIRCHGEYINLPVLGDKLYGLKDEDFLNYLKNDLLTPTKTGLLVSRQLLHASALSFTHPFKHEVLNLFSDPLKYFEKVVDISKLIGHENLEIVKKHLASIGKNF